MEFNSLLTHLLRLKNYHSSELNDLFRKIDYDSTGFINWDKFCTYMHLELCLKENVISKQKQVGCIMSGVFFIKCINYS